MIPVHAVDLVPNVRAAVYHTRKCYLLNVEEAA